MANFDDSTIHMSEADIKKELKTLKKKVKQMEAQRERIRDWAHKAELLDAKKNEVTLQRNIRGTR